MSKIQSCYLHQHIFQPTRYRVNQEPSLLDLVFTNEEGMLQDIDHCPGLGESDHECLNFHLNCYKQSVEKTPRPYFLKGDYVTIRARLKEVDWKQILQGEFLLAYLAFLNTLEKAMDGCIPNHIKAKKSKNIYLTNKAIRMKDLKKKMRQKS